MQLDHELGEVAWPDEERQFVVMAETIRGFIDRTYSRRGPPYRRDAHPKAHGAVRAIFRVEDEVPAALAHGVLAVPGAEWKAWVRFSNGNSNPTLPDIVPDARGMAVKLVGVPGAKILESEPDAQTQDFICINHPVFFIDDPRRYLKVVERGFSPNKLERALVPLAMGIRGSLIAAQTPKVIASPLECRFWSTVPYTLGSGPNRQAIKFSFRPSVAGTRQVPTNPARDFLRDVMVETLAQRSWRFDFLVQPRVGNMSVEDPRPEWREADAPFVKVATLTIAQQTFSTPAQDVFAENLSFTPWHSLPEHRPLGGVNRARRVVYETISTFRHEKSGTERKEPTGDETFA